MDTFCGIVICKTSLKIEIGDNRLWLEFVKGKTYKKFFIDDETKNGDLKLEPQIPYKLKSIYVYNNDGTGIRFHLDKNNREKRGSIFCFYDYFYDENEIRKMKLKQLNK